MISVRLSVFTLVLALAGCTETRFESPIGEAGGTCENALKGLWIGTDNGAPPKPDDDTAFHVDAECGISVIERGHRSSDISRTLPLKVEYATVDGKNYLAVEEDPIDVLVAIKPPHGTTPIPPTSYFFVRYRVRGDRLDVYPVDSKRTAKLVVDEALDGTVDKTNNELHVYVRGTPADMRALIHGRAIFDNAHPLTLVRSRMTPQEFTQASNVSTSGAEK